ncbi:MAG: hypothetical protein AB8F74_08145 [Saprospiraceae bacterium]
MKKYLISVFVLMFINSACTQLEVAVCEDCQFSCNNENETDVITNSCKENYDCTFKIYPNSKVVIDEEEGFQSGNKTVFQLITSTEGSPLIADDEFVNILVMELDSDQTSFSVSDEELSNMNVHFKTVCFCADVKFNAPDKGCIQGLKQADGSWLIQGNLLFSNSSLTPFKFNARFSK